MPKLQNGEGKYLLRVARGAHVVGKHSLHSALLKIATRCRLRVKKKVVNPILQIQTQPFFVRNGEPSLFAIENFARNAAVESLLGDVLGGETTDFKILRQRGGKFEDLVVEQGNTKLQRIGHGHLIGLNKEIIGEPGFGVDIEHFAEWTVAMNVAKLFYGSVLGDFFVYLLTTIASL